MPEIAVVIPAYIRNRHQLNWLIEAVNSVLDQTFQDREVIVVNDCSPHDMRPAMFNNSHKMRWIEHDRQRGPGAARNTAVASTSAKWIVALDADDRLPHNALEAMYAARCEYGVVYGDIDWIGERQGYHRTEDWTVSQLFKITGLLPVTALHSRIAWQAVGGWDENLPALEDNEYWMRLAARGVCGQHINNVTLQYRKHSDSRQSLLEQDKHRHRDVANSIRQIHAALYSRLSHMAKGCSKCPGSEGPGNGVTFMAEGIQNGVELKYIGLMRGSFTLHGRVTGIKYKIGGKGSYVVVDAQDVSGFLEMQMGGSPNFVESKDSGPQNNVVVPQAVSLKEAPPSDKPNITEMKAAEAIELITGTDDALDLRVWLAEERANDKPRKTVLEALETRINEVQSVNA